MSRIITVNDCPVIELPKHLNRAGNLTAINNNIEIPFPVKRVFYIYDIPGGGNRGAHSHKECHQLLVAASGSFEIELNDGNSSRTVMLNRPYYGLYIPPYIWAAEKRFSSGSVCLVLTSNLYDPCDYIRDYNLFIKMKNEL